MKRWEQRVQSAGARKPTVCVPESSIWKAHRVPREGSQGGAGSQALWNHTEEFGPRPWANGALIGI